MIKVSLEYYNDEEEILFKSYPNSARLDSLVGTEISISKSEFLAYMMFTEQKDREGFRSFKDLESRVSSRLGDIDDYLDFSSDSIISNFSPSEMKDAGLTERIGVGLGLSTINQFHGLTEADWAITDDVFIDGKKVKDFDFKIPMASNRDGIIQVENKGAIIENNSKKPSNILIKYKDIKAKKGKLIELEKSAGISKSNNLNYGTIAVLDNNNTAKLYLVDPPAFDIGWSPLKFKLIARLSFYLKIFKKIGVHVSIRKALEKRIELLKETQNIDAFDGKRLDVSRYPRNYIYPLRNFVKINTNEAYGSFYFVKTNNGLKVLVMALPRAIFKLIINQDFDGILNYNFKSADLSGKTIIELSSLMSRATEEILMTSIEFRKNEKRKRFMAQYYGPIEYTSSGRIFGVIK